MPEKTVLRFDSVAIVQSLGSGDLKTGRILFDEVEPIAANSRPPVACRLTEVNTRAEFLTCLQSIADEASAKNGSPILQLETHGSEDGIWLRSGEFLSWKDLKNPLTEINEISRLNLLVVLAACEGANLVTLLQPTDRAPVLALIGPRREISAGDVERGTLAFYRTLFTAHDAAVAWRAMNEAVSSTERTFAVSTAEFMLRYVMHHYLRTEGTEAALAERQRRIEARLREEGVPDAVIQLWREPAGRLLRDHHRHFSATKHHFLFCDVYPENESRFGVTLEDCIPELGAD